MAPLDIKWMESPLLKDCKGLRHGTFLRHGGVSPAPYASLNFGLSLKDNPENVLQNTQYALGKLGLKKYARCSQIHGDSVASASQNKTPAADSLITNEKGVALIIKHADCQAGTFYDPIHHALGLAHAGWRGSVKNIYAKTVEAMQGQYGSKPENLLVSISPSLGPDAAEFINYKEELPESFYPFMVKSNYFDFWAISHWQLTQLGILPHHIDIAKVCTYSNTQDYFSHRKEKETGRNATIAALL